MVRRVLIGGGIVLALALGLGALSACTPPAPNACLDDTDCFGGEVCIEELCRRTVVAEPDAGEPFDCRTGASSCGAMICDATTGRCEPCASDEACGEGRLCDSGAGECVTCLTSDDCGDPTAPVCDGGDCVGCVEDADCVGFDGRPVCSQGACVACTLEKDEACMGHGCDVRDHTCSDWPRESRDVCESCTADSECAADDMRCVPMTFDGQSLEDAYCMRLVLTSCAKPYPFVIRRESLSGEPLADYCAPHESLTTCEAVADFGGRCDDSSECGHPLLDDGVCGDFRRTGTTSRYCSYRCSGDEDCSQLGGPSVCVDDLCQYAY